MEYILYNSVIDKEITLNLNPNFITYCETLSKLLNFSEV